MSEDISVFNQVHSKVTVPCEGGISNDPHDNGGLTAYGVSLAFLKSLGETRPAFLKSLLLPLPVNEATVLKVTPAIARQIFYNEFWVAPRLYALQPPLASDCYDIGVNMGVRQGVKLLQAALNNLFHAGLVTDGLIGPKTIAAQAGLKDSSLLATHAGIIEGQCSRYNGIANANPTQKRFLKGWLNRSARLDRFVRETYFR